MEIIATYNGFLFSLLLWLIMASFGRVIRDWKKRLFAVLILLSLATLAILMIVVSENLGSTPFDVGSQIGTLIGIFAGWYPIGGSLTDYLKGGG